MSPLNFLKSAILGGTSAFVLAGAVFADDFNIPGGDLSSALSRFSTQTGVPLIVSADAIKGVHTRGAAGDLAADVALSRILAGTGFMAERHSSGAIAVVHEQRVKPTSLAEPVVNLALATGMGSAAAAGIESVVVTSSKIKGDIQTVPIAITALSQEQLTSRQIAGGPDLVKEVPNLTFSKTNFTGYNIQIRGIGTQAISVTTDPAVAVAFNDIPFIRNHFFEQEFYDVNQVEILRGPQGTLYGRNATAGVVNLVSARPTDQFEAMLSAEAGNYHQRRFEGMVNIPIVDDTLGIRLAGEWTKRDGYSFNETTQQNIDGRDLWSARATIGWKPSNNIQTYFIWEHFAESDDRIRSGKQLCKLDPGPDQIDGTPIDQFNLGSHYRDELSQGCRAGSLYDADAFQVPDGYSLSYVAALMFIGAIDGVTDPYARKSQSRDLRVIESTLDPIYDAKNDIFELNTDYAIVPTITFTSQSAFNHDFLYSTQDYNRYNTSSGIFLPSGPADPYPGPPLAPNQALSHRGQISDDKVFCDPQLGCTDRLVGEDLSSEHSWQLSQEFRLASSFSGPFNFSIGGNYLHYETVEDYYVFINALTLLATYEELKPARPPYIGGVTDNTDCLGGFRYNLTNFAPLDCVYIDPNPLKLINGNGHNYFRSQNPYTLNSYAAFGEFYYDITGNLKLTAGLRWTKDEKHFVLIPSQVDVAGWGYPVSGAIDQKWGKPTGRVNASWTPNLNFTDQTLVYGSYAHGYKAGGANPPGATLLSFATGDSVHPTHPLTFKPEFVDAFELGTKNTLLDGAITLNGTAFYYNYKNYQISYIVDRTSVNLNFDAHVKGAELEATWEPLPGFQFNFAGGWEDGVLSKGQQAIDLMDRTAGHSDWMVAKPSYTQASNCIFPSYVVAAGLVANLGGYYSCGEAYSLHLDPVTHRTYVLNPTESGGALPPGYPGFNPLTAPNNGEGFAKEVGGNKLPNAPPYTVSLGAQYSLPITDDWAGTLRGDFYWQDDSWARVWNDDPYDHLHGYRNLNLALILTSQGGWQIMLFDKNVFNTTAITGTFLNTDDTGLTTNVFLTDPRLIGVRVTRNW